MNSTKGSSFARGGIYGLAAVCIWASLIVVSRLGVQTSLTPWDVAAIRFTVAGALLLPYVMRRGIAVDRLGWTGVIAIIAGCGAPMVLLVNAGLRFAPAAHGGALFPGVMPLMVAILAVMLLREPLSARKGFGLALIVLGAVGIVWGQGGAMGTAQTIGHAMFLLAGLAWVGYTMAMRRARLDGLDAAAIAAGGFAGVIRSYLCRDRRAQRLQGSFIRYRLAGDRPRSSDRDREMSRSLLNFAPRPLLADHRIQEGASKQVLGRCTSHGHSRRPSVFSSCQGRQLSGV